MLGKLFKYEWRSITKLLLPVHGCILLFALLSRFYFSLGGGVEQLLSSKNGFVSVLTGMLIFALVVVISSMAIFTYIYTGYHFYKNVFTDQGYLTNTLPVTSGQILLAKEFAALLWILIDVLVIVVSCMILVASKDLFSNFGLFWTVATGYMGQMPSFTILMILSLILMPIELVVLLYFSIAIGNLASNHKVLASIGAYVGLYIIQQIFGFIELMVVGFSGKGVFMSVNLPEDPSLTFQSFVNPILLASLIFGIILTAACWMGSKYIMSRKLNLQ